MKKILTSLLVAASLSFPLIPCNLKAPLMTKFGELDRHLMGILQDNMFIVESPFDSVTLKEVHELYLESCYDCKVLCKAKYKYLFYYIRMHKKY